MFFFFLSLYNGEFEEMQKVSKPNNNNNKKLDGTVT